MIKIPYQLILEKIRQKTSLSEIQIEEKIKKKIDDLGGLVSKEGAAHILANEYGVEVFSFEGPLKIKEIFPGMRNLEVIGRVLKKFELRTFEKGHLRGKVANLMIGDETGQIRVVFWHDQTENFNLIKEGDIIRIKQARARENNNFVEIHLDEQSKVIINPEGTEIGEIRGEIFSRKKINEIRENELVELNGFVVQIFEPRFFTICPDCNKKLVSPQCQIHPQAEISWIYNLPFVFDDGSGTTRVTLWRERVNSLLNKTSQEVLIYKDKPEKFNQIKQQFLGLPLKIKGKVVKNKTLSNLEINGLITQPFDSKEEIQLLEEEITSHHEI